MADIRLATVDDMDAIRAFAPAVRHPLRASWFEQHVRDGNCFVALQGAEVVGYAIFAYTFFLLGFIEMLAVAPEHRRKGVASSLVRHAEKLCTTDRIFASTNTSNRSMQCLMAKLSYVPSGMVDLDPGDPEIVYSKRLAEQ